MGDGQIFPKSRHDVSFKKGLSNEPTFGLIHLAGQYLSRITATVITETEQTVSIMTTARLFSTTATGKTQWHNSKM